MSLVSWTVVEPPGRERDAAERHACRGRRRGGPAWRCRPEPLMPEIWSATKSGWSHWMSGRKASAGSWAACADTSSFFERVRLARPGSGCFIEHVAARRRPASCSAIRAVLWRRASCAGRLRQLLGDDRQGVAAQLEALDEVVLAPSRAGRARRGCAPGRRAWRSRSCSAFAWFWRSTSWFWSLGASRIANSRRLSAFDRPHELVRVADVVLHVAFLAGVQAALERQHEQNEDKNACAGGYGPPDQQRLAVRRGTARRAARRAAYRLVRFVEEGQANRS